MKWLTALALSLCAGAALAEDWSTPITNERQEPKSPTFRWQSSFDEFKLGRHAPVNAMAVVGVPGWPVLQFGHLTYLRYSEFLLYMRVDRDGQEIKPYTLPGFRQRAMEEALPAIATEFDEGGIHYVINYMAVPTEGQPVDMIEITLTNQGAAAADGRLMINLDGAPTLKAKGEVIEDRGKPLAIMEGRPEEIRTIERPIGLVDPRCTSAGALLPMDVKDHWRDGWYGMPIEYNFAAEKGKQYQVFLGTDGTPPWLSFGNPYPAMRKVILSVEGDEPRTVDLNYGWRAKPLAHAFTGRDVDGDGVITVASRATADSRQPAILNAVYVYDADVQGIDPADLAKRAPKIAPKYTANVGANNVHWMHDLVTGDDPTWRALSLRYTPRLAPGESKTYLLKLPAIDKPEIIAYCNSHHPFDTDQSWMRNLEPRHPENTAAYGEDVPPGVDPADYAVNGPKPRKVWKQQVRLARAMTPEKAREKLKAYWEPFFARRVKFNVPDRDLDRLYRAQLAILNLYVLKFGPHDLWLQMCGPNNYYDFCYRDNSYILRAWEMAGYHDIVTSLTNTLMVPASRMPVSRWTLGQHEGKEDGLFLTRPGQWDGQGQNLGALADHYLLSGDRVWLETAYPSIARGAEWIIRARQQFKEHVKDENDYRFGLMPPGALEAGGEGTPFYINAYCIYGLRQSARVAEALGKTADAEHFRQEADQMHAALRRAAQLRFVRTNDYCGTLPVDPIDQKNLGSWPGSSLVYPLEVFDPFDPLIDGWYRFKEAEAAEGGGLMGFPYILTDWVTSYIRRGQPDRFVDLFGAYVDIGCEMLGWSEVYDLGIVWKDFQPERVGPRGIGDMPHGEACSNYILMLRNMLLHEEGDTLHVAPATPRRWMQQSETFGAEAAPTYFGPVSFSITPATDRRTIAASVKLDAARKPARLLLHLRTPAGRGLGQVTLNGQPFGAFNGDTIIVANPPETIEVHATLR